MGVATYIYILDRWLSLAPINFLFIVGFGQFQFVTELVEEILVNITCALLMMEATTSETSLMLVCYDIS